MTAVRTSAFAVDALSKSDEKHGLWGLLRFASDFTKGPHHLWDLLLETRGRDESESTTQLHKKRAHGRIPIDHFVMERNRLFTTPKVDTHCAVALEGHSVSSPFFLTV